MEVHLEISEDNQLKLKKNDVLIVLEIIQKLVILNEAAQPSSSSSSQPSSLCSFRLTSTNLNMYQLKRISCETPDQMMAFADKVRIYM